MPFIEMNPEATDIYNHDEVLRYAGFITGLAAKLYRSPEEVEQIRAARAQQQQIAQQMAENESAANTLNKLGSVQDLPGMEEMAEELE
jgi:phosphosulfolactate phosphohydrolase-like enzyme